jgi:hypothetical protein
MDITINLIAARARRYWARGSFGTRKRLFLPVLALFRQVQAGPSLFGLRKAAIKTIAACARPYWAGGHFGT